MSSTGQPDAMLFGDYDLPSGTWLDWHVHEDHHQLAWAARGVVAVNVGSAHWVLPPARALWIPAGTVHRTGSAGNAVLRGIFMDASQSPVAWPEPRLVRVRPLLRELLEHLTAGALAADALTAGAVTAGPFTAAADAVTAGAVAADAVTADALAAGAVTAGALGAGNLATGAFAAGALSDEARRRAEAVAFDLLEPVPVTPISVPMPRDARARRVADALIADPADDRTLEHFGRYVGASDRTLARLFVEETRLSFGRWRTQVRLRASLPLLADGRPLARVAECVGYSSPSAFVAAFRRAVGVPPGRYFG